MSAMLWCSDRLFDKYHHLNDEGVALFVDASRYDCLKDIPRKMRDHVSDCLACMLEIAELETVTRQMDYSDCENPFRNDTSESWEDILNRYELVYRN